MLPVFPKFLPPVLPTVAKALVLVGLLGLTSCFSSHVDPSVGLATPVTSAGFLTELERVSGTPWIEGNRIKTLLNGDAFFPPMLAAVRAARRSITFETFAFVDAPVTREFARALAAKVPLSIYAVG